MLALASALAVTLAGTWAPAQSKEPSKDVPTFGVTTELVYVRFHVEKKNGYVNDVGRDKLTAGLLGRGSWIITPVAPHIPVELMSFEVH